MYDIDLRDVFANRQEELRVRLARARSLPHPTSAGDEGEEGWTEVLRDFLPRRYDVARHRFVIDAEGRVSQQQDIVIYDGQFAPTFLVLGETQFIPVESVYAVLEVKTTMNRETVVYAGEKAASVRRLTHSPGKVLIYTGELVERAPIRPIAGLLCHDSDWADPFGEHFADALAGLSDDARLDMGCVALKGAFSVGVDAVVSADTDRALIAFCVALFDLLQKLGNAPGIDAIKYGRNSGATMTLPQPTLPTQRTTDEAQAVNKNQFMLCSRQATSRSPAFRGSDRTAEMTTQLCRRVEKKCARP